MNREQLLGCISTVGLLLLLGAVLVAHTHGMVSASGAVVVSLPPLLMAFLIAGHRKWSTVGASAFGAALAVLMAGTIHGASIGTLGAVLLGTAAVGTLFVAIVAWRWPVLFLIGLNGFVIWWRPDLGPQGAWGMLTALWLAAACTTVFLERRNHSHSASWLAIGSSTLLITASFLIAPGSPLLMLVEGMLVALLGFLLLRTRSFEDGTGYVLVGAGSILIGIASFQWLASLGLILLTGAAAMLFAALSTKRESESLRKAAGVMIAAQVLIAATTHPLLFDTGAFHLYSLSLLLAAGQVMFVLTRLYQPPDLTRDLLWSQVGLYLLACFSTTLFVHVSWQPALTLLWAAATPALWLIGSRIRGMRYLSLASGGLAILKLILVDWSHLTGPTRVLLLAVVGAAFLIGPATTASASLDGHQTVGAGS